MIKESKQFSNSLMFLAPAFLLMTLFIIGPIFVTLYFSFTDISLIGSSSTKITFIGFKNFVNMFQNPEFKESIIKTIIFFVFSAIIGQQVLGFLLAYLMRKKIKTIRRFVGVCILAGWVAPEIVGAFIWISFLDVDGSLNMFLKSLNCQPISWLITFPMISVVVANIWRGTAFSMMMFDTALADIPGTVEEASIVDGASTFQRLRYVIIPMIKNTIATNMIIVTLSTIGMFGLIFAMTGGGPGIATQVLTVFMYKQAFVSYQLGYGTAISMVILIIGILISILYIKTLKSEI